MIDQSWDASDNEDIDKINGNREACQRMMIRMMMNIALPQMVMSW